MASKVLQVGANYATGATVSAYPEANWSAGTLPPSGSPQGSATTTAVVASDGTVTFTGLTENTNYFAYVSGGTPAYLRFRVDDAGGSSANPTTVQPASGALFSVDTSAAVGSTALAITDTATASTSKYCGLTIRETAGSTAVLRVRNNNVSGTILDTISLAANESVRENYPVPRKPASGTIYLQLVSGTVEGSVFYL